jgi:CheY-like chemotaxis protein
VNAEPSEPVWQECGLDCTIVPSSDGYDVLLRNGRGVAFIRRSAATPEAAHNEAEFLRLLLECDRLPSPPAGLKPFALVVEDDPENCDALSEALKAVGVRALGVASGLEAVRLAKALAPDLVIIDHRLPDITGAEVCRRLRADPETEPLPVIAVTGAPDALRDDGCVADAILTKPCRLDTFLAAARLFLRPLQSAT